MGHRIDSPLKCYGDICTEDWPECEAKVTDESPAEYHPHAILHVEDIFDAARHDNSRYGRQDTCDESSNHHSCKGRHCSGNDAEDAV